MEDITTKNRNEIKKIFANTCSQYDVWQTITPETQLRIINNLEKGCFNASIVDCKANNILRSFNNKQFTYIYSSYCYNVTTNLDINGIGADQYLIKKIINDPNIAHTIAKLTSEELNPNASKTERELIEKSKLQKISQRVSTAHKCGKCGKNSTIFYEMQLRAADESTTYRMQCTHCYHTWYVS